MMKFMGKCKGSISVFLLCILLPMVVFEGLLIDGSKMIAAKTAAAGAGEMAMNGALADYDTVIKDVYGLFAVSSTDAELQSNIEKYYKETLNAANIGEDALNDACTFLNMTAEVNADYVDGSDLSNTAVLKAQILEYMKYRGLVSVGTGLLDKFTAFSSLYKQQKVVEDKMKYDEKLGDVQDELQAAYDAINNAMGSMVSAGEFQEAESLVEEKYENICNCIITYQYVENLGTEWPRSSAMAGADVNAPSSDKEKNKDYLIEVLDEYTKPESESRYASWKDTMDSLVSAIDTNDGNIGNCKKIEELVSGGWESKTLDKDSILTNEQYIQKFLNYVKKYKEDFDSTDEYWVEIEDLRKEITDDIEKYNVLETYLSNLKKQVNKDADTVYSSLSSLDSRLQRVIPYFEKAVKKLKKAEDEAKQLEELKEEWKDDADGLPDGEVKNNMSSEVKNRTEELDTIKLTELKEILSDIRNQYEEAQKELEKASFHDEKLYQYHPDDYMEAYTGIVSVPTDYNESGFSAIKDEAYGKLSKPDFHVDTSLVKKDSIQSNEFYTYLSGICTKGESDGSSGKKEDAKETRSNILKNVSLDIPDYSSLDKETFPEQAIKTDDGSEHSVDTSSGKDKKISQNATKASGNVAKNFEKLADLLVNARNDVLIEEYVTEMFSCYTTKDTDVSLSGNLFSEKGKIPSKNYGAEVEYLLFGKSTPSENVKAARNRIFGVRFVLNLIYAFTGDPEIKTETLALATAIAGWTGFGVPIVQNVLVVSLALAESVLDTTHLMEGEDVVVYKSKSIWICKLSGIGKETAQNLIGTEVDKTAEAVNGKIADLVTKADQDIDVFNGRLQDMIDEKTETLVNSAINMVFTPIQNLSLSLVPDVTVTDEEIEKAVEDVFANVKASVDADQNEMSKFAGEQCLKFMESEKKTIANGLKEARNKAKAGSDNIDSVLTEKFKNIQENIAGKLKTEIKNSEYMKNFKDTMDGYADELKKTVDQTADSATGKVNETAESIKSKMNDEISSWSSGSGNQNLSVGKSSSESQNLSVGTSLTMNYKEYLKLFTIIGLIAYEDGMIKRIGNVIELNVQSSPGTGTFSLASAYTMVEVQADVSVSTSFMRNVMTYLEIEDSPSALDNQGKFTFSYQGIAGY